MKGLLRSLEQVSSCPPGGNNGDRGLTRKCVESFFLCQPNPARVPIGLSDVADNLLSVMALCERHRSNDLRQNEIHERLGILEETLADRHKWFDLTRVQRRQLPAAQPFCDLEDELEKLGHESARLVTGLRRLPASSLIEAIAKLAVVARVIEPDDYPDAHALLMQTIVDLATAQR